MNPVPVSALIMVTVALLVVWLFLARMIRSRHEDARLQFLLNLVQDSPAFADSPVTTPFRGPHHSAQMREATQVSPLAVDARPE